MEVDSKISPEKMENIKIIDKMVEQREKEIISYVKQDMELLRFEILYSALIPKKERQKMLNDLKKQKRELWNKALKMAKGKPKKAIAIYDSF